MSIDKRKHDRQDREEKILIEVLSASETGSEDNILLECSTQDISVSGLKIQTKYPLLVNSILELLINFESGGYKFLLTGEVKWLEQLAEDKFLAGFELIEAEHSDYYVWQNMFDSVS